MNAAIITTSQIKQMEELRAQGLNNKEISKMLGIHPHTVGTYLPKIFNRHTITPQMVEDMKTCRELGLSNKQIAIELGISYTTVTNRIGPQPDSRKSQYGSIVSHANGESYLDAVKPVNQIEKFNKRWNRQPEDQKEKEATPMASSALELVSNTIEFKGKVGFYKIDMHNGIEIESAADLTPNKSGPIRFLAPFQLHDFITELQKLQRFLETNKH